MSHLWCSTDDSQVESKIFKQMYAAEVAALAKQGYVPKANGKGFVKAKESAT